MLPEPDAREHAAFGSKQKEERQKLEQRMHQHFRGSFDEFVQVECGYKHTLLLNKLGQVFSFGEGLQGQLGLP